MADNLIEDQQDTTLYGTDAPISDPHQDHFDRWPFAQRVAQTIADRRDPSSIVIGIYGAWGEGKTSVLNFIARELSGNSDIVCVKYDPWRLEDESQILTSFFTTMAEAIDRSLHTRSEKFAEAFKKYAAPLVPSVALPPINVNVSQAAAGIATAISTVELDKQRDRIESMLKEEGKRVVILMDDIDRLDRSEIQAVFKLVKLTANFAFTAYVLAFDESVVAASLNERYASGSGTAGRDFLEKIIQVALHLPAASFQSLNDYCLRMLAELLARERIELTEEQVQRFREGFDRGLRPELRTPRNATRYNNVLTFSLPLLRGEVDPVDLMLIEGVRVFYPRLYLAIREHRESFLARSNPRSSLFEAEHRDADEILEANVGQPQKEPATRIIEVLFPRKHGRPSELFTAPENGPSAAPEFGPTCGR